MAREVLDITAAAIKPGVTTLELDRICHEACIARDSYPSPLNYGNFPRSICTSINEVICHGIPDMRPLKVCLLSIILTIGRRYYQFGRITVPWRRPC
jgi:methionine aminopeptidase